MLSRNESKATEAIKDIKEAIPSANVEFLEFDLQNLSSAKKAAESFIAKENRLDILVNNAGIVCFLAFNRLLSFIVPLDIVGCSL